MKGITFTGEVVEVRKTKQISDTFSKRELWMEIDQDTEYPQTISVEFIKDKCDLIGKFKKGDKIEVDINARGNRATMKDGTERVFNSWNGWRVRGTASGDSLPSAPPPNAEPDDLPY